MGDSRAYLLRGGELTRLTEDHSAAAELTRSAPDLDRALLAESPLAHVLTRCLGKDTEATPDIRPITIEKGDRLLLCCDGLTDMVPDARVEGILSGSAPPEECCRRLIEAANKAGGKDNITVLVVDVSAGTETAPRA